MVPWIQQKQHEGEGSEGKASTSYRTQRVTKVSAVRESTEEIEWRRVNEQAWGESLAGGESADWNWLEDILKKEDEFDRQQEQVASFSTPVMGDLSSMHDVDQLDVDSAWLLEDTVIPDVISDDQIRRMIAEGHFKSS